MYFSKLWLDNQHGKVMKGLIIPFIKELMGDAIVQKTLSSLFDPELFDFSSLARADGTLDLVKTK
jgi:hypothetical protein